MKPKKSIIDHKSNQVAEVQKRIAEGKINLANLRSMLGKIEADMLKISGEVTGMEFALSVLTQNDKDGKDIEPAK